MRTVRASEIGVYLYCRRAWWYQRHGMENINQTELAAGKALHERHGQRVIAAGCLRALAWLLLLTGLAMVAWKVLQTAL